MSFSSCEFSENHAVSRVLYLRTQEPFCFLYIFVPIWIKFCIGCVYKNVQRDCKCRETGVSGRHAVLDLGGLNLFLAILIAFTVRRGVGGR
jgi:hypothetical protein